MKGWKRFETQFLDLASSDDEAEQMMYEYLKQICEKGGNVSTQQLVEIREKVAAHDFTRNDVIVEPTISIGIAELTEELESPEDLVRVADEALYRAKNAGRNNVSR